MIPQPGADNHKYLIATNYLTPSKDNETGVGATISAMFRQIFHTFCVATMIVK